MYQYSQDHTGCFSYVGTLGASKMGCSSKSKKDFDQVANCNCGGGASPDMSNQDADKLLAKSCEGGAEAQANCKKYPPYLCPLGGPEIQIVGADFATCTSEAVGKKAVLYAYKKMSPIQALAALPNFLGKLGKDLLGDLTGGLMGILKIVALIAAGVIGVIILLMVIRFAWNQFTKRRAKR
jgi:hypothetical protein